jgi:hypothetical protein
MVNRPSKTSLQNGQSMVEYVVILSVLTLALVASSGGDSFQAMELAVQDRQRGYTFAVSMSALPESDTYKVLADYYDDLGKYPELSKQLHKGGDPIDAFVVKYRDITAPLVSIGVLEPVDPSKYYR